MTSKRATKLGGTNYQWEGNPRSVFQKNYMSDFQLKETE